MASYLLLLLTISHKCGLSILGSLCIFDNTSSLMRFIDSGLKSFNSLSTKTSTFRASAVRARAASTRSVAWVRSISANWAWVCACAACVCWLNSCSCKCCKINSSSANSGCSSSWPPSCSADWCSLEGEEESNCNGCCRTCSFVGDEDSCNCCCRFGCSEREVADCRCSCCCPCGSERGGETNCNCCCGAWSSVGGSEDNCGCCCCCNSGGGEKADCCCYWRRRSICIRWAFWASSTSVFPKSGASINWWYTIFIFLYGWGLCWLMVWMVSWIRLNSGSWYQQNMQPIRVVICSYSSGGFGIADTI